MNILFMDRILLIDDDIDDAGLFREALDRVAPSVSLQCFSEGEEALQSLMEEKNALPDIIFLDINMPKVNGWECLAKLRKAGRLKQVPVFIYSTSSEDREVKKAITLGANGLIRKPDDFTQLKQMLTSILAQPVGQLVETLQTNI